MAIKWWDGSKGSSGIRQWPINKDKFPMMVHKITSSGWNVWTLNLMNQPNQNSKIVPKVVKPMNKKTHVIIKR